MEREPFPASLLPAPGGSGALTDPLPRPFIGSARHGGAGATEEKTPGTGPGATGECLPRGPGATGGYPAVASSAAGGGAPSTHIR